MAVHNDALLGHGYLAVCCKLCLLPQHGFAPMSHTYTLPLRFPAKRHAFEEEEEDQF